jgi:hypothetical protein
MTTVTEPIVAPVVPVVPPVVPVVVEPVVVVPPVVVPEVTPTVVAPEAWEASGDVFVDTIAKGYLAKGGSAEQFTALLEDVGNTGTLSAAAKVALKQTFGDMADALIPTIEDKAKANLAWVTTERKAVYDVVGGQAVFEQMQEWSKANLDASTREFLNTSLGFGGKQAQMAVAQLKELMVEKGATVKGMTFKVDGTPVDTGNYIGLAEYITQNKILQKSGDVSAQAALKARANASMKAAEARGERYR